MSMQHNVKGAKREHPGQKTRLFAETGRTIQSAAADLDINNIMKKYQQQGVPPDFNQKTPTYGDFSASPDYQTSLNIINQADEAFMSLPSGIRDGFRNNPALMLEFMDNPENEEKARDLGLLPPLPTKREERAAAAASPPPTEPDQAPPTDPV